MLELQPQLLQGSGGAAELQLGSCDGERPPRGECSCHQHSVLWAGVGGCRVGRQRTGLRWDNLQAASTEPTAALGKLCKQLKAVTFQTTVLNHAPQVTLCQDARQLVKPPEKSPQCWRINQGCYQLLCPRSAPTALCSSVGQRMEAEEGIHPKNSPTENHCSPQSSSSNSTRSCCLFTGCCIGSSFNDLMGKYQSTDTSITTPHIHTAAAMCGDQSLPEDPKGGQNYTGCPHGLG